MKLSAALVVPLIFTVPRDLIGSLNSTVTESAVAPFVLETIAVISGATVSSYVNKPTYLSVDSNSFALVWIGSITTAKFLPLISEPKVSVATLLSSDNSTSVGGFPPIE